MIIRKRPHGTKWEVGVTNLFGTVRLEDFYTASSIEEAQEFVAGVEALTKRLKAKYAAKKGMAKS